MSRLIRRALPVFLIFGLIPCQAVAAPFRLTSPQAKAPLGDAIRITVASPAAGRVVFRARWSVEGTRRTRTIASVAQAPAARSTSFTWDASAIADRDDVEIVARVLDREGDYLGTTAWRRLSRAPSVAVRSGPAGLTVRVAGTCVTASCTLNVRAAPDTAARRTGVLDEHDVVAVECRAVGAEVSSSAGASRVWNLLATGGWVSDLYVEPVEPDAPAPRWC